jgi:hypothetical protein
MIKQYALGSYWCLEFVEVCTGDSSGRSHILCLFLGLLEHDTDEIFDNDFDKISLVKR